MIGVYKVKIIKFLIICAVSNLLGSACAISSLTGPALEPTRAVPTIWIKTWLTKPTCAPPCWQNITPGKTSRSEAFSILEQLPDTTISFNTKDDVEWEFGSADNEGGWFRSTNDIVDYVILSTVNSNLTLKTIVPVYGYPSHVVPSDCRNGMCVTSLVYVEQGMFLNVFIENKGWDTDTIAFELPDDTVVDRVHFLQPGLEEFRQFYLLPEDNIPIWEWKEYGTYP